MFFRPTKSKKSNLKPGELDMQEVIKNSYSKKPVENMNGYNLDKQLSNHNQQVYYNPKDKKLMVSVAGTHGIKDWVTDFYLATGNLKATNRYKEAEQTYKKAKEKYNPMKTITVGHSLGSSITNYITGNDDKSYGLDGGYTLGQKARNNSTQFRSSGDVVSLLGAHQKNMKTLQNPNFRTGVAPVDMLRSHNVDNIAGSNIKI